MLDYNRTLKEPSRNLRNNMTDAERLLWSRLRCKQLLGVQFYRQKPIGNFIVDFFAPAAKLVIEVDGCQHLEAEHQASDELRDEFLAERGLLVLRFDNRQVLLGTDAVVARILDFVRERLNPP
jgi:very-short-patch-repair endonuclease